MELNKKNKQNFEAFLRILGKSEKTINNYSSAIVGTLSIGIKEEVDSNINDLFTVVDPLYVSEIKEKLFKIEKFKKLDEVGKNMYSAGIQQYITYLEIINWSSKAFVSNQSELKLSSIKFTNFEKYLTAIRTKPFILLAGISGTGKSRIVRELAYMSCQNTGKLQTDDTTPGNFSMIEVKPNWHDSSELLGYSSAIQGKYIVTPFVKFIVKAMRYPEVPFFVCLDEMNLAPVEQYFAEYLSVLETRKEVDGKIISGCLISKDIFNTYQAAIFHDLGLYSIEREDVDETAQRAEIEEYLKKNGLRLPQNLIVVRTVNMDDTTHQFSRKVIDRAMTIEMNDVSFEGMFENSDTLKYNENPLQSELFIADCVSATDALELVEADAQQLKVDTIAVMNRLNIMLRDTPFKVAYRVQNEFVLYYRNLKLLNPEKTFDELFSTTVDAILNMKVLPRVEGDEVLVEMPLKELKAFCYERNCYTSATKIEEMLTRLERSHYTSYWPNPG